MNESRSKKQRKKEEFQKDAAYFVKQMKAADEIAPSKVDSSYTAMMQKLNSKQQPLITLYYRRISAIAAILILLIGWAWWKVVGDDTHIQTNATEWYACDDYSNATDITLLDGSQVLHLKDSANIHYQNDGYSNVAQLQLEQKNNKVKKNQERNIAKGTSQIIVPKGKRAMLTLSDGTCIHINSGTTLTYPKVFSRKEKREIFLDGEAYLTVAKKDKLPFIVHTDEFDVHVLGTEFNVLSRQGEKSASVVLVNGRVEVTTDERNRVCLNPDQRLEMNEMGAKVENVDVREYISWKDGILYLNNKCTEEIFAYIESHYDYEIACDPQISNCLITGKLDLQDNINDIMKSLSILLGCNYSIKEHVIYMECKKIKY